MCLFLAARENRQGARRVVLGMISVVHMRMLSWFRAVSARAHGLRSVWRRRPRCVPCEVCTSVTRVLVLVVWHPYTIATKTGSYTLLSTGHVACGCARTGSLGTTAHALTSQWLHQEPSRRGSWQHPLAARRWASTTEDGAGPLHSTAARAAFSRGGAERRLCSSSCSRLWQRRRG